MPFGVCAQELRLIRSFPIWTHWGAFLQESNIAAVSIENNNVCEAAREMRQQAISCKEHCAVGVNKNDPTVFGCSFERVPRRDCHLEFFRNHHSACSGVYA